MKAYEIKPDDDNWPHNYCINASHKWGLPGVECSNCGFTGGWVGSQYPALSLPKEISPEPYLDRFPVSPEMQKKLQAALLKRWKSGIQLHPGTDFGPLVGTGSGKCGDFGWVNNWTPLITREASEKLKSKGISELNLVKTEISWRRKKAPEYFELNILPSLKLAPSYIAALGETSTCKTCGTTRRKKELSTRKERLSHAELEYYPVLAAHSFPKEWSLLRVDGWEAKIVASEAFRDAVIGVGLVNVLFVEIAISQD